MRQPGAPRLRAPVTLVVTLYAFVLMGALAAAHAPDCSRTGGPHCALCAWVSTPTRVAEPAPVVTADCADGGAVTAAPQAAPAACFTADVAERAPPVHPISN